MAQPSTTTQGTSTASVTSPFHAAIKQFQNEFANQEALDFGAFQSINDVYKEINDIQEEQGRRGQLRNMKRIKPFLDCLEQYSSVLDTFVQVKPDVLALIWGPIKFLLQISKNYVKGFDKVLDTTRQLGDCLPQFKDCAMLFKDRKGVQDVLCLFYRDILDFYANLLRFFRTKGWKQFFEALWPRFADRISKVAERIEYHKSLLDREITFADIYSAQIARTKALEEYERSEQAREQQSFEACRNFLAPRLYDQELQRMKKECCKDTCHWLEVDHDFQRWLTTKRRSSAFLWLTGMPGAGKSHLSATFVSKLKQKKENILFVFLSFQNQESANLVAVLHTLIFQILYKHQHLRPVLIRAYQCDTRDLQSFVDYNQKLLTDLLQCIGPAYVVLDGVDEISGEDRQSLLRGFIHMTNQCTDIKVMVSSRDEVDISDVLHMKAISLRIGLKNSQDIETYWNDNAERWLSAFDIDDAICSDLRDRLQHVPRKAEGVRLTVKILLSANQPGMFLYAKLVLAHLKSFSNIEDIKAEITNLPAGLNAAYGRIIGRIKELSPGDQPYAKKILEWISCSRSPLRKQEIIQALAIREDDELFIPERKPLKDIRHYCGPIIEFDGEFVCYVHFTAKEYISDVQSGPLINDTSANLGIAHTCMTYLMLTCFDPNFSEEEMTSAILHGHYVLQPYATSHWLEHVKAAVQRGMPTPEFEQLCQKIREFLSRRTNSTFRRRLAECKDEKSKKQFEKEQPSMYQGLTHFEHGQAYIYKWLGYINSTMTLEVPEETRKDLNDKYYREPLVLRSCWDKTQHRYEDLICISDHQADSCSCDALEANYGSRLYKCTRLVCKYARTGFSTKAQRDRHTQSHERSFKCGFPRCQFATIGFFTQNQLKQHADLSHFRTGFQTIEEGVTPDLDRETLEQALLDTMEVGETEYLNLLLDKLSEPPLNLLIHLAYLKGSGLTTLEILKGRGAIWDHQSSRLLLTEVRDGEDGNPGVPVFIWKAMNSVREEYNIFQAKSTSKSNGLTEGPQTALTEAIEGGSVEVVRWLLDNGADVKEQVFDNRLPVTPLDYLFARQLFRSKDKRSRRPLMLDIAQLLLESGSDVKDGRSLHSLVQCQILPEEHSTYLQMAKLLLNHDSSVRKDALHYVIGCNYSWDLGQLLLENGADIEAYYTTGPSSSPTPLMRCLTANHRKAAEFARALLESGANTDLKASDILEGKGYKLDPKKFAKWTGVSWDELVESTHRSRASASIPP